MKPTEFAGFIPMKNHKHPKPWSDNESKSKRKKRDYSEERKIKRGE